MLAFCFALLSCAKQEPQAGDMDNGGTPGDGASLDYITAVSPGVPVKTTTADGVKVLWTDSDKVGMYAGASTAVYTTFLSEPSSQATFGRTSDVSPIKADGRYYAVYPSSAVAKWRLQAEDNDPAAPFCAVNVPKQQTAVCGAWDKKAAVLVATSETDSFAFKHAVSYLRFEVTDQTGEFVSVRLASTDGKKLSDPQASVQFAGEGQVAVVPSASASNYVTLRNAVSDSTFAKGVYYIGILPGDYAGLALSFINAEGLVAVKTSGTASLKAGEVSDWGQISDLNFTEQKTPLEIATVYKEKDANIGVVYWIDPDNPYKGKIVSPSSTSSMDWSDGLIWTEKIQSQDNGLLNYQQFNDSEVYTGQKERFYALKYCEDMRSKLGGNWYLPASAELRTLFKVYYGLSELPSTNGTDYRFEGAELLQSAMAAKADFDSALSQLGETVTATLDGDADADGVCDNNGFGDVNGVTYWSSKVNTGGAIQYVNIGVYDLNNTGKVAKKAYVRCVRDVDLNASVEGGDNEGGNDDGEGNEGNEGGNEGAGEDAPVVDEVGSGIDPLNPFDVFNIPKKVSLVGDSITTFEGTLVTNFPNSENGGAYYPTGNVTSVSNQYWHKLIYGKMSNAVLEVNNSLRGSTVIWRDNTAYDGADYCARVERHGLGNPDVVLIHGGTNDCTKHSQDYAPRPGMYRADMYPGDAYSGMAPASIPTAAEFKSVFDAAEAADTWEKIIALEDGYFIHAYVKLLNMIHFKHPNAKVVIIIGDALTKRAMQALVTIADHYKSLYGYRYVDFFGQADQISKAAGAHPDDAGFTYMANKIYDEVGSYIDPK